LSIIALENVKLVVDHPATLVTLGNIKSPSVLMCLLGVMVTGMLLVKKVTGAMLIGIMVITGLAWALGFAPPPSQVVAWPSLPKETLGAFDFSQILTATFITVVLAFLFVDIFDTAGTLMGVGRLAGFVDKQGHLPGADRAFTADAVGTTAGAYMGTSALVCYIESATGVEEGARTGLAAVAIGLLFLAGLFFTPLFIAVPAMATAPALLIVGAMMMEGAKEIEWNRLEEAIPAFLTVVLMPLTYSIAHGISVGIVSYTVLRLLIGRYREIHPITAVLTVLLILYYAVPGGHGGPPTH
jgi:AGZA family xanthine/uracil permease-like MFS transporter